MKWMTEDAIVLCTHQLGTVGNQPSQGLVTVDGRKVLVDNDPESRQIRLCPNYGITVKPCNRGPAKASALPPRRLVRPIRYTRSPRKRKLRRAPRRKERLRRRPHAPLRRTRLQRPR